MPAERRPIDCVSAGMVAALVVIAVAMATLQVLA